MTLPDKARLETLIAPGVALYDVSHLLPKGRHRRATKRPQGAKIRVALCHHSGALGMPGFEGLRRAVAFMTQQRDFPESGYHFWFARDPLLDAERRPVLLRALPDPARGWHSGARANDEGVGLAFQGNTSQLPLSPFQIELLEAAIPWLAEHYGWSWEQIRSWLGWHSIADRWGGRKKVACPGHDAERWLRSYLDRATAPLAA